MDCLMYRTIVIIKWKKDVKVSLKNKHSSLHILVVWVWEDNDEKEKFALDKIRLLAMGPEILSGGYFAHRFWTKFVWRTSKASFSIRKSVMPEFGLTVNSFLCSVTLGWLAFLESDRKSPTEQISSSSSTWSIFPKSTVQSLLSPSLN